MSTKLEKKIDWVPAWTPDGGTNWKAFCRANPAGSRYVGSVRRTFSGRWETIVRGRQTTYYGSSIRDAARVLVANVNNIYPSQLPR